MSASDDINDRILRLADTHSPEEISRELKGLLSPARVRLKLNDLLSKNGRSWLDDVQREEILMWRLQKVVAQLERNSAVSLDHTKVLVQTLKLVGERLDKRQAANQVDLKALYSNQAQIMYEAIRLAFTDVVETLRQAAPEITDRQAREALGKALPQAVLVISERNVGDEVVVQE